MKTSTGHVASAVHAARSGHLDPAAPVQGTGSRDTGAPPHLVWEVLSDIDAWPRFVPGVSRARLQSDAARVGARFCWMNGGVPLKSTIQRAEPDAELTWTGTAWWIVAVHRNVLDPRPDGGRRLTSSESMAGFGIARLMSASSLEAALDRFVTAIIGEAERRSG